MNKTLHFIAAAVLCLGFTSSCCHQNTTITDNTVIPYPQKMEKAEGSVCLKGAKVKIDNSFDEKTVASAKEFGKQLKAVSGAKCCAATISIEKDCCLAAEQYTLTVNEKGVQIAASDRAGVLYALASLKQLLPVEIYGNQKACDAAWTVRYCSIEDQPDFSYRGMHLDVSRHFFSTDEIKRYLDVMAAYKLNRFHWHLTDDQGWRAEIKKYPELTEVGQWRKGTCIEKQWETLDGVRYGGFYTQEEMKEIVAYADNLGITVIPEVDLPGHMLGALATHPEFGCTGGPYETWTRWGVSDDVLCAGNEKIYGFLDDVLGELAEIFPCEYFHIGGDECPKARWKECPVCQAKIKELGLKDTKHGTKEEYLQNYVTARIQKIMESKGKKIIGWDEVTEGELAPGTTVMWWRGWIPTERSIAKYTADGFDVILTPTGWCYFDNCQSKDQDSEPFSIGGFINLQKIYDMQPRAGLTAEQSAHVVGLQANLWTEYIATNEHLEYMLLPRMLGLSCVQWTGESRPDYDTFVEEVRNHQYGILDQMGYNYKRY